MLENLLVYLPGLLGIVVIDLVLSGDNAVVIGMAARRLPPDQRRLAILLGGGGAIGLRVLFAAIATVLLAIPLLQVAGGLLLLWIAWRLLRSGRTEHSASEAVSTMGALRTIILADVVMSLDNILAVAGASHGSLGLLAFGLMLSMPLILMGSSVVAAILNRLPWLELVGAGVLTWTAGIMIVEDELLLHVWPYDGALQLLPALLTMGLLAPSVWDQLLPGRGVQRLMRQVPEVVRWRR